MAGEAAGWQELFAHTLDLMGADYFEVDDLDGGTGYAVVDPNNGQCLAFSFDSEGFFIGVWELFLDADDSYEIDFDDDWDYE